MPDLPKLGVTTVDDGDDKPDVAAARWQHEYRPMLEFVAARFSDHLPDGMTLELVEEETDRG